MKPEAPRPVLLDAYAPPAYLIDSVALDVVLHPTCTHVKARLKIRRNPAAKGPAPQLRHGCDGRDTIGQLL